ncbi:hypothetical protein KSF78_0002636 [Schistosoma japonicum]|nr:hypothetical protein KSF78_0002636 [Schistosoma japonicum]
MNNSILMLQRVGVLQVTQTNLILTAHVSTVMLGVISTFNSVTVLDYFFSYYDYRRCQS